MEKKKLLSVGLDISNVMNVFKAKVAQIGFEYHNGKYDYNNELKELLQHIVRSADGTVELSGNITDIPRTDEEGVPIEVLPYELYDEIVADIVNPIIERLGSGVIIDITCNKVISSTAVFNVVDLYTESEYYE